MLRPLLLLLVLVPALGVVSVRAWLGAGETARRELTDRSEGVADVLAAAVRASRVRARSTEEREVLRLQAVARRIRAELARPLGPAAARLEALAEQERLGRVFLFGAGGARTARIARPAPPEGAGPLEEAEWRRARETAAPLLEGGSDLVGAGARLNVWGTLVRIGAGAALEGGGAVVVEADAEDVAALARGSDLAQVLVDVCRLPDVAHAVLQSGEEAVAEAGTVPSEGFRVQRTLPADEGAPLILTLDVSRARVEALAAEARRGILLWTAAALALAALAAVALWRRAAAQRRERASHSALQREQRHLAEMGVLTGLLVHELSSPLNALALQLGALERALGEGGEAAQPAEEIARMRRTLGRVRAALETFLTLAPAESAGGALYGAPTLARTLDELREEHPEAGLELKVEPAAAARRMQVREAVMDQAVRNVLRNALQAQPAGEPVRVTWAAGAGGGLSLSVRDAGPGFPPAVLERGPALGRSTKPGGHGLGLFLAQRAAAGAGGRLVLENAAGGGAQVVFEVPAAPPEEPR